MSGKRSADGVVVRLGSDVPGARIIKSVGPGMVCASTSAAIEIKDAFWRAISGLRQDVAELGGNAVLSLRVEYNERRCGFDLLGDAVLADTVSRAAGERTQRKSSSAAIVRLANNVPGAAIIAPAGAGLVFAATSTMWVGQSFDGAVQDMKKDVSKSGGNAILSFQRVYSKYAERHILLGDGVLITFDVSSEPA